MYPWCAIVALSGTPVSVTFMLCFVLDKYGVFGRKRCWRRTEFCWDGWHSVEANFVLFVTNWLRNSGKMKGYPYDKWTVRIWTVKFPGDTWIVEILTVKTGLGLRLWLGFLLWLDLIRVRVSVRFRVSVVVVVVSVQVRVRVSYDCPD